MSDLRQIIWEDSGQQMASTWTDSDLVIQRALELDTTVKTVGYVLLYNDKFILVAQSVDNESGLVSGVMRISRDSVKEITSPK